jgi:hypothetical protein
MSSSNFYYILEHIHSLKGAIIEIGSSRGEGSTEFFAGLIYSFPNINFHTVDFSKDRYQRAANLALRITNMFAYKAIGESWLEDEFPKLNQKVCWAYLDNADWNWWEDKPNEPEWIKDQKNDYHSNGVEYSNAASLNAHLLQSKLIHNNAAEKCIIQLDDTWLADDTWPANDSYSGKGGLAVPWLLSNGWKIIDDGSEDSTSLSNF